MTMALKKKSAKEIVTEVIAKVEEEVAPKAEAPKTVVIKEENSVLHYYRCNITLDNGKECNCPAFM